MKLLHALHFSALVKEEAFGFEPKFFADMIKDDLVEFLDHSELIKKEQIQAEVEELLPLDAFSTIIYQARIKIDKKADKMFRYLYSKLSEKDQVFLKETIETRVDDECNCYLRFDKTAFVENKVLVLVDHGDCIHLRIKVAAFPAKKDNALAVIKELVQ